MKFDFGSLPARIGKALQGVFGSANKRALAKYWPLVKQVNALADEVKALTHEQIRGQVAALKQQVQAGEVTLEDVRPRMFALTREAATRTLGIRHFDVHTHHNDDLAANNHDDTAPNHQVLDRGAVHQMLDVYQN